MTTRNSILFAISIALCLYGPQSWGQTKKNGDNNKVTTAQEQSLRIYCGIRYFPSGDESPKDAKIKLIVDGIEIFNKNFSSKDFPSSFSIFLAPGKHTLKAAAEELKMTFEKEIIITNAKEAWASLNLNLYGAKHANSSKAGFEFRFEKGPLFFQ